MRLIDAEVLANWIDGSQRLDTEHDYEEVARYIEECPTVDAVPVVRCEHCAYRGVVYDDPEYCWVHSHPVKPDGFCDRGKPKEDRHEG